MSRACARVFSSTPFVRRGLPAVRGCVAPQRACRATPGPLAWRSDAPRIIDTLSAI